MTSNHVVGSSEGADLPLLRSEDLKVQMHLSMATTFKESFYGLCYLYFTLSNF